MDWICKNCNETNDVEQSICKRCKKFFKPEVYVFLKTDWKCLKCGVINNKENTSCCKCNNYHVWKCPDCGAFNQRVYENNECNTCPKCYSKVSFKDTTTENTMPSKMNDVFKIEPETKTLKTEIRSDISLEVAVRHAYVYVQDNDKGHTKVEFKCGNCWIVVAKLKG